MRRLTLVALLLCSCIHLGPKKEEASNDDIIEEAVALRLHPRLDGAPGELTLTLSPPGEMPVWSCTGHAQGAVYGCLAPTNWFKGAGEYELLAEWAHGKNDVVRAVTKFPVGKKREVDVTLFGLESPRHLEIVPGEANAPPSSGAVGSLTREQIKAEISRAEEKIHGCYQGALEDSPGLSTKVVAWFLIGDDGSVREASAEGAPQSPALVLCLLAKVRQLRFPAPAGGALAVTYPWTFVPPK